MDHKVVHSLWTMLLWLPFLGREHWMLIVTIAQCKKSDVIRVFSLTEFSTLVNFLLIVQISMGKTWHACVIFWNSLANKMERCNDYGHKKLSVKLCCRHCFPQKLPVLFTFVFNDGWWHQPPCLLVCDSVLQNAVQHWFHNKGDLFRLKKY